MARFFEPAARVVLPVCALLVMDPAVRPARGLDPARAMTQYVQSSWNSENGLPQNSVHAIAQTTDGYLWLGTEEGLARFDGVQFTVFTNHNSPGLGSDYILALLAGRDGSLWIGTDSGLSHWTAQPGKPQGTFQPIGPLSDNRVTALAESADGTLWAGTSQGLNAIRGSRVVELPASKKLDGEHVLALETAADGSLWAGTERGVFRLKNGSVHHWTRRDGLPYDVVSALAVSSDGDLWLGTLEGGIAILHDGRISIPRVRLPWKEIDGLLLDRNGALWIAFDRHGLARLYQGRLSTFDSSKGLPTNRCTKALLEDREGNLWVGLLDDGLVQLRAGPFAVFGKPEGLAGNYTGDVLQSRDGSVWIGSDGNGISRLFPDGRIEFLDHRKGLPDSAVYSLLQTRDGSMWIGYRSGELARLSGDRVQVFKDPQASDTSLNALFEDHDGNLWTGFYGKGVARVADGRFEHLTLSGHVPAIAQSPDGALWIAGDGEGVERWLNGKRTRYTTENGLPSNHVMCLLADSTGDVWVGTASGGLSRIRNGQVVTWTVDEGLPGTTVGSITADNEGNLWLGGDSGIARIRREELESGQRQLHPRLFTVQDGLRSRETVYGGTPSTWKSTDGRLWFATIMGAAVIDPSRLAHEAGAPPVSITAVGVDGRALQGATMLETGTGQGNLHVVYTAPGFVAPARMQFRYRLEGFDRDWIAAGTRREAWYTNLPPGRYVFHVQAANSDGIWNGTEARLNLVLRPPLSRTPLAYAGYVLAAFGMVWLIVSLRTRRLLRNREELNRIVAERTSQLEEEKAALEEARRELHTQATHDSLTGIFNRGAILEHLDREMARAARERTRLGVILADLDHFKQVNDSCGHLAGDEVIRETVRRMQHALRAYDLVGRYGGEEFLILMPGWDPATAEARTAELMDAIRSAPFEVEGRQIALTCSFGVATFSPEKDPIAAKDLLRSADEALYAAKHAGRDQASLVAI